MPTGRNRQGKRISRDEEIIEIPARVFKEDLESGFDIGNISAKGMAASFDSMGDGVFFVDAKGIILYVNRTILNLYESSQEEMMGSHIKTFFRYDSTIVDMSSLVEAKTAPWAGTIPAQRSDGSVFWISLRTAPIFDDRDRIVGYIGIARDVSDVEQSRRELQGEVNQLEKQLENRLIELTKRFDQLEILQELGKRMVLSTSEEEIAENASTVLVETLDYASAGVVFITGTKERMTFQLLGSHTKIAPGKYGRKINEGPITKALKDHVSVIEIYPTERLSVGVLAKSELVVPLIVHDKALGALIVADPSASKFKPDDISIVETVADLVAISLTNCLSSRQVQDRTLALNLLDEVTLQAISTMDISGVLSETAQRINDILETQSCLIGMIASDGGIDWVAVQGAEEFTRELKGNRFYDDLIAKIVKSGTVYFTNDYSTSPFKTLRAGINMMIHSALISPIQLRNETIGVIALLNRVSPGGFSEQDADLVKNFSDHLAVLIHNAETMASLDYSLRTRNSLLRTTFDLQMTSGVSEIYQKVSEMLLEVVPYDAAKFYNIREEGVKAVLSRNLGEKIELSSIEDFILDQVMKALSDLRGSQSTKGVKKPGSDLEQMVSVLTIPLIGREDAIGAIVIARAAEKGFSEQDLEVATLFANHTAITLENAGLLGKEKELLAESLERVKQLESILELTTSVMSMGRQGSAVDKVLSAMPPVLGFNKGIVMTLLEEEDDLGCSYLIGFSDEEAEMLQPLRLSARDLMYVLDTNGKRLGERTATLNIPVSKDKIDGSSDMLQMIRMIEFLQVDTPGDKFFFIMEDTEGDPTGVIILSDGPVNFGSSRDKIGLLEIFGNLASIAVNNERLLEREVSARSEIETLNDLMTHDINNFTQGVLGYLEMISMDNKLSDRLKKYAQKAMDQVENTKRLIENVRKLSSIRATAIERLSVYDLGEVISGALESLEEIFPKKTVRFNSTIENGEYYVPGDDMVHELFANLISNAIKFTPTSNVRIDLNVLTQSELGRDFLRIEIVDYGRGIPDDKKLRVFERFGKLEKEEGRPYGFGIGLSIVKNLVKKYGGRVWVESRIMNDYRKGSRFVVMLPKIVKKEIATPKEIKPIEKKKMVRKMKLKTSKGSTFQRVLRQPQQDRNAGGKAF